MSELEQPAPHLRLIQGGEPEPQQEQLFTPPEPQDVIPPDLQLLTDRLHDLKHVDLAKAVLVQYARYERLRRMASRLVTMEGGDGGAA